MTDRLRELLYPLTILTIVATLYALAMARSYEAEVERHLHPSVDPAWAAADAANYSTPIPSAVRQVVQADGRDLLD